MLQKTNLKENKVEYETGVDWIKLTFCEINK